MSQISAEDLTYAANLIQSRNFRAFEVYSSSTVHLPAARDRRCARILRGIGRADLSRRHDADDRFHLLGHPVATCCWRRAGPSLLSLIAFVGGGLVGLALLFARVSQASGGSKRSTSGYIEFFQGTPLLMQLFLFFFGLALFGIEVSPGSRPGSR